MLKRYLLYIFIVSIFGAYILNRLYECYLRPDSLFFSQTLKMSEQWDNELRKDDAPCYVFTGGSEVRMSVEPQVMLEEQGVRAINAGVQVGCGVRCNAQIALPFLRKGDTLLVSYISGSTSLQNDSMTHCGINFCHTMQGITPFTEGILPISYYSISSLFRGSALTYAIHVMRLLTRPDCIYRYSSPLHAEISRTGRVNVFLLSQQQAVLNDKPVKYRTPDMRGWVPILKDLKTYCQERGINVAIYVSRAHQLPHHRREIAAAALYFIDSGFPVLKDPYLGCWPEASMYSDTALHLSIEGGQIFSEFLAIQLKNQQYWNREELLQIINEEPANEAY